MAGTRRIPLADTGSASLGDALLPVCVLAGGLGTRLGRLAQSAPKALVEVAGEPFVFQQLRLLSDNGASRVVLCVGHKGEMIEDAVGATRFGLEVAYSYDSPGLDGTLGAIRRALPLLGDRFLVMYGDTFLPIDFRDVQRVWLKSGLPAVMTVLRNDDMWGRSNAVFRRGLVVAYDKKTPSPEMSWIDYGLGGLSSESVAAAPAHERDLSELYTELARKGALLGYEAVERFHEIGTPEALEETRSYFASGREHGTAAAGPTKPTEPSSSAPWSEELEQLHQESSRTHFLDTWTRSAMLARQRARA